MMNPENDETVLWKPPPPVIVRIEQESTPQKEWRFSDTFRIGRDKTCEVQVKDSVVSRFHLEIRFDGNQWWICDLNSANGTYMEGVRIQEIPLSSIARLEMGCGGVVVVLAMEGAEDDSPTRYIPAPHKEPVASMTQVMKRYFGQELLEDAGEYTMTIRRAFQHAKKKHSRKYIALIGFVVLCLVGVGGITVYQQSKLKNFRKTAEDIFYSMKALELQIIQMEAVVLSTADPKQRAEITSKRAQIKEMESHYDHFVEELDLYGGNMSEEEKLIFRVARIFGECESNMPDGFVQEVQRYIQKWRSSGQLSLALQRATQNRYINTIVESMLAHHLPPQFFYVALKESTFNNRAVGPNTRFGFAKGIWQFLPTTGTAYGLRTGPLVELPLYDPRDERYAFEKSTQAAAQYLRKIYTTEAQASGLLVIASYNWGENNIRKIIRKMPTNPKERNFWRLLKQYKIPRQTYDYVLYIIAAAVIGENPRLFGFDFDNPLSRI